MRRFEQILLGVACGGWLAAQRLGVLACSLSVLAASAATACRRSEAVIARLESVNGQVEGQHGSQSWGAAVPGATFQIGDAVRTQSEARAGLTLFNKSRLALEPSTLVRFLAQASSERALLDVELGNATLEVADEALELELALGTAVLSPRSRIRLSRQGATTQFEVMIGSARLLTDHEAFALRVGEAIDISPEGKPQRRRVASSAAAPSAESPAPSATAAVELPGGSIVLQGETPSPLPAGPQIIDFTAAAGESFSVHDPKPPSAVALTQNHCAKGAVFALAPTLKGRGTPGSTQETQGGARVSMSVPAGTHRYTISCLNPDGSTGPSVAQGTITVLSDDGSRALAKTAPLSQVETDGRRYTVLYQGHLPGLAVQWPKAPEAASYALTVRSSSGTRTFASQQPRHVLASGTLAEGEHSLSFEGAGRRSKPTEVVLRFDNAAPTASISSPADGSFASGSSVRVSGTALPGFSVSVGGQELPQDGQNRFSGDVRVAPGERALWIRFSHPRRGVHYYLRRSGD